MATIAKNFFVYPLVYGTENDFGPQIQERLFSRGNEGHPSAPRNPVRKLLGTRPQVLC